MVDDILTLIQKYPLYRELYISGPTQIGRQAISSGTECSKRPFWAVAEREIPPEFNQLEMKIVIEDLKVSRNHCGIFKKDGEYYIIDLNSRNGTYLNGININPERSDPRPIRLGDGDNIKISCLNLCVGSMMSGDDNHHALLVGHDGGNLQGVKNDLNLLSADISKRGYAGNILELYNGNATKRNLMTKLELLAGKATKDSHTLIFYSGHGNKDGLKLGREKVSPEELYRKIDNIRGKKAVILDCCHAGIFVDVEKLPEHTLIIAASSQARKAYERLYCDVQGFLGIFTRTLHDYMGQKDKRFNLKDFQERFQNLNIPVDIRYQEPSAIGTSFTICTLNYGDPPKL